MKLYDKDVTSWGWPEFETYEKIINESSKALSEHELLLVFKVSQLVIDRISEDKIF